MEAKKEEEEEATAALLHTILPPRLEDAGLEDCALPPDSIQEAFLRAATAVNSRATSIFAAATSDDDEEEEEEEEETPNCINDQWPTAKGVSDSVEGVSSCPDVSDTLVVADPQYPDVSGPCGVEKNGGVVEEGGDKVVVVVGGGDDVEGREGCVCVIGLKGLKIKEKVENGGGDEEEEEEERDGDKKPILTQGFV